MKRWIIMVSICLILGGVVGLSGLVHADEDIRSAIVKVYSVYNKPDYYNPWNMQGPRASTGSGAVIEGNLILTNAHVVSDLTFLQVRKNGDTQRYSARTVAISHESDLAIIEVADPSFFEGVVPLTFGELPRTHEEVNVYGFPMGGDTLSITKGVLSRVEHQPYVHSSAALLAGQIDAAINPGNSGGPVINNGKIVGVIMQGIPSAQNLGYMVPTPVIEHFLSGIAQGNYLGTPSLGTIWQRMENPDLRSNYQMSSGQTGVLVTQVYPGSPADGQIFPGDVLLSFDDFVIANDGTVEFRSRERTSMSYPIQKYQVGESITVELLRDGEKIGLDITLHRPVSRNWLIPMEQYETVPSYYIYGGLVFTPVTKNLLHIWGSDWVNTAPVSLVSLFRNNIPEVEGQQVVMILRVLADEVNVGYENVLPWIVRTVNGQSIMSMTDLVRAIEDDGTHYTKFENARGQQIVLNREAAIASNPRILATYRIENDRSADLW